MSRSPARLALVLLVLLLPATAARGDETDELLARARNHELTTGNHAAALDAYLELLKRESLPDVVRYEAIMGAARCYAASGLPAKRAQAAALWREVVQSKRWTDAQKKPARERLRTYEAGREAVRKSEDDEREVKEAVRRARDRAEAARLLDLAEAALDKEDIDRARTLLDQAAKLGGYTARVQDLLRRIIDRHPDSGQLIHDLTQFIESKDLGDLHELLRQAGQLYNVGKSAHGQGKYAEADNALLQGLDLIDASGFLVSADVTHVDQLANQRARLSYFAVYNREIGIKQGLTFERPIPKPPASSEGQTLMSRLRFFLADVFGGRDDGAQPLRFYVFLPPGTAEERRALTSKFGRLSATAGPGTLGRVRWAERYIRDNVAASWKRDRIFQRFGHVLCVKHQPSVHRRIQAIRDAFGTASVPTRFDLYAFATTSAGIAKACEALGARAPRTGAGHDAVIPNRLVDEARTILQEIPGQPLQLIGSARLALQGTPNASLQITDLTKRHPTLAMQQEPPVSTGNAELARFGLWLDLYSEPLPRSPSPADMRALSVVLRMREPVGSTLIPRRDGALPFTRVPRMLEQRVEADHAIPTTGTLMVVGLRNPFPGSNNDADQLVLLIGARGDKAPDPPRETGGTSPRIIPADEQQVIRPIGALASEVLDYVPPEAWPREHAASAPITLETAQSARFRHLQDVIARGAKLIQPDESWESAPIQVQDGDVVGSVSRIELRQLDTFLERLRRYENDVYDVDVRSVVTTPAQFAEWVKLIGATSDNQNPGLFVLGAGAATAIDALLDDVSGSDPMFTLSRRVNARATQRIGVRKLMIESIVRDQALRAGGEGGATFTAVPGVAEQGLIIEVRRRLESSAPGYHALSVRARAALLRDIKRIPFPHPEAKELTIELPRWHPLSEVSGAPTIGDRDGVLLRMVLPGSSDRVIAIRITAKKVR